MTQPQRVDRREALRTGLSGILVLGAGSALLGGCASGAATGDDRRMDYGRNTTAQSRTPYRPKNGGGGTAGVLPRSAWAKSAPVPSLMNTMLPVNKITLHHDGMDAFTSASQAAAAERIERIRVAHRGRDFGDVGYHYLIDPAGRVWEGRTLNWQGAHVANQNPGNLGICVMGNYEEQYPTPVQLEAVERFVSSQMRRFGVSVSQVYTHRELAATACPGRNLQPKLVAIRRSGGALAMV